MRLPLACEASLGAGSAGTLAPCLSAQATGWLVRGVSTAPRTLPEGEEDLHQTPYLQTAAPRRRSILGGAQMLEVPGQQLRPKTWNFRLWLKRFEAVGWIWSLASFTQPISREVWLPNFPAEHQEHKQALPGYATPVCPAGVTGKGVLCVSLVGCVSVSLLFLHSQFQAVDQKVAALWFCFIGFGFISFFGFSVWEAWVPKEAADSSWDKACGPCRSNQMHQRRAYTKPASLAML